MEDRRDLTEEEIESLPLELQVCWFIQPWNISAKIDSVEKWIDTFWAMWDVDENLIGEYWEKTAREKMKIEFDSINEFVHKILDIYGPE